MTETRLQNQLDSRGNGAANASLRPALHGADTQAEPSAAQGLTLDETIAAIICPHAFEHRQGRHQPRQDRSRNRDRALSKAREILTLPEVALTRYLADASADDRHDENLIGAAEREVGRWVYRRIERLMNEAEEGSPEAAELAALADITASIEEYGEEACADEVLTLSATPHDGSREGGASRTNSADARCDATAGDGSRKSDGASGPSTGGGA